MPRKKIEIFMKDNKEQLPKIWDNVKRFGARIWDGIRRAWGWLMQMVSTGFKRVKEIGLNMSRIIYDFALGSFTIVSNVMSSIGTTIQLLVNPVMPGSDLNNVMFTRA